MFILLCFSRHALHLLNNFYYMLLLLWKLLKTQPLFYHVLVIQLQLGLSVTIATKMQGNPKKNPPQATKSNNNRKNHPPPKKPTRKTPSHCAHKELFLSPVILGRQLGHSLTFYFQLAGSLWVAGYEGERDKCVMDITSKLLGCGRWLHIFRLKSWSVRRAGWWGRHSWLSLSSACTGNLFSYQHHGMQACQSLLSCCSDHTGKRQLFSKMKRGATAAVFFIQYLWLFLHSCFLHPASHGRIEVPIGTVLFQRWCGTSQGGLSSWVSHSKLVISSEEASFCFSDSMGAGSRVPQGDAWLCSFGKAVMGHFAGPAIHTAAAWFASALQWVQEKMAET